MMDLRASPSGRSAPCIWPCVPSEFALAHPHCARPRTLGQGLGIGFTYSNGRNVLGGSRKLQ
jgi:hypothetical protein